MDNKLQELENYLKLLFGKDHIKIVQWINTENPAFGCSPYDMIINNKIDKLLHFVKIQTINNSDFYTRPK